MMPFGRWPCVTSRDFLSIFNVFISFWLDCTLLPPSPQPVGINIPFAWRTAVSVMNILVDQPRTAFPYFLTMRASKSSRTKWSHATGTTGATGVTWAGKSHVLASKKCKHYLCRDEHRSLLSPNCSLYSNLSLCTERVFDCLLVPWPNPFVEEIFVDIHTKFFRDCPTEELSDPPPAIVFALVITPICLIPVMVSLVVLKTKNGDGSSWKPGFSLFRLQDNHYFRNFIALCIPALEKLAGVHMCFLFIPSTTFWETEFRSLFLILSWAATLWFRVNFLFSSIIHSGSSATETNHLSRLHTRFKEHNLNFTVFGVIITRAPELAKVKVTCIYSDTPHYDGQQLC